MPAPGPSPSTVHDALRRLQQQIDRLARRRSVAPAGAIQFPAAVTLTGGSGEVPLDGGELYDADFNSPPSWISVNTSTNRLHITEAGVYAHHVELRVNNGTAGNVQVTLTCSTTNLGTNSNVLVPAGETHTVTIDRTLPYLGDELSGDQILYLHLLGDPAHATGDVIVYGSGNSTWSIAKIG